MTADTPNGGGWADDPKRMGVTIGIATELVMQIAAMDGRSLSEIIEEALVQWGTGVHRGDIERRTIADALARIEAKLNALDKSPQVVPDPRPPHLRKIMDEDNARMLPHGTDMRPGGITWVEDDGA